MWCYCSKLHACCWGSQAACRNWPSAPSENLPPMHAVAYLRFCEGESAKGARFEVPEASWGYFLAQNGPFFVQKFLMFRQRGDHQVPLPLNMPLHAFAWCGFKCHCVKQMQSACSLNGLLTVIVVWSSSWYSVPTVENGPSVASNNIKSISKSIGVTVSPIFFGEDSETFYKNDPWF